MTATGSFDLYDDDTITVQFTVTDDAGAVKNITGATLTASAVNLRSHAKVPLTSSVEDGINGLANVQINEADLTADVWRIQLYVEMATGDAQTVADYLVSVKATN